MISRKLKSWTQLYSSITWLSHRKYYLLMKRYYKKWMPYNYNHVEVKSFTVGPGSQTMTIDNVCNGKLPKMLKCSFVDNQAYSGKRTKNPFKFENFNISQFHLIANGRQIPTQSLSFDYSNEDAPNSSLGYDLLFRETKLDRNHQITKTSSDKSMFMI